MHRANGANCTVLRAVVLTQYQRVTDGQTDGIAIASTALAKRRAIKIRWIRLAVLIQYHLVLHTRQAIAHTGVTALCMCAVYASCGRRYSKNKVDSKYVKTEKTSMGADAQRGGRTAEYSWPVWRPLRKFRNYIPCTTLQSLADARCWCAVQ